MFLKGIVADMMCQKPLMCCCTAPQPGQEEDEQMQRPEVREEDLTEAKSKLGTGGPAKSKTFEVMEECGKDTHTHMQSYDLTLLLQGGSERKQSFSLCLVKLRFDFGSEFV